MFSRVKKLVEQMWNAALAAIVAVLLVFAVLAVVGAIVWISMTSVFYLRMWLGGR